MTLTKSDLTYCSRPLILLITLMTDNGTPMNINMYYDHKNNEKHCFLMLSKG